MKVWAAVQIQSTARCPASVVSWWCTDKEETKHGETTVQVKFASKHYKSTTKLAPQNNIWQFLVALSHKKPWEIFVCSSTSIHFCFMRNTRGLFKGLVLILGNQNCKLASSSSPVQQSPTGCLCLLTSAHIFHQLSAPATFDSVAPCSLGPCKWQCSPEVRG